MSSPPLAALRTKAGPRRNAAVVAGLLALATCLNLLLDRYLTHTSQAMLYLLAVVAASYSTSLPAALACSVASAALLNFLFVTPPFTFRVDANENATALVAMFVVALVISARGGALRTEAQAARLNEARARQLQQLATELADVASADELPALARRFLDEAFDCSHCAAVLSDADSGLQDLDALPAQVQDGLRACVAQASVVRHGNGGAAARGCFLPLVSEGGVEGAAYVPGTAVQDSRDLEHAQAICALLGQALWRLKLGASVQTAQESARWHRAQSTFLAGISHDFRTPLAAMVTAASSLQAQRDKLDMPEQQQLTQVILDEAGHLAVLTENTLQFARLENAGKIQRDWQAMEEIVGSVLARVRQRDSSGRIHSKVPAGLPLIQADPVLLAQLLDNLLDNALKYSDGPVDLVVSQDGDHMEVAVQDRGQGITPGDEEAIFEPYRRSDRSGHRGAGLGLAVCRAIARAHGGELELRRRDGGGSSFVLRLTVPAMQPRTEAA